ncbi:MAG: polysaccharide deacetylase family protein [Candidatus Omnitrophica bacterium]|nr:polysaccharide deacetylase family protein [Candidatus Omnitrophota bacterium]
MKLIKRALILFVSAAVLAAGFYLLYMRPRHVVPILMYHAVSDKGSGSLYVSPENFSRQMAYLEKSGYKVISLDELVSGIREGRPVDRNSVVITFDDGHEDNFTNAFPVLAKYGFPATVFLITGYMGERKGYLNWDQVLLMQQSGIAFGAHTRNDIYLPAISGDPEKLWREVRGSGDDIHDMTGKPPLYFCYPIGGFNDKVKNAVKKAGYKGACTTNRGSDRFNRDVYELTRVKVTNSDTTKPLHFRAKLSGYYNLFRSMKSPE